MTMLPDEIKTSESRLWENEYTKGGIPSSVRERPSNVVVDFHAFVRQHLPQARTALDIGCGTGRNSIYLASEGLEVSAVDYARSQIDTLRERIRHEDKLLIRPVCHDISTPWPFPSEMFDIAIDCFCFKHQIHSAAVQNYIREVCRTLKTGGYYMLFLAAKEDGYYRMYSQHDQTGPGTVIMDPANNIASRLYDIDEIKQLFGGLTVLYTATKPGENEMHGRRYTRSSHIFYMRK